MQQRGMVQQQDVRYNRLIQKDISRPMDGKSNINPIAELSPVLTFVHSYASFQC
jgi:hypothetical protein